MAVKIVTERKVKPPVILLYGENGIGKTTFAASFPSPVFIQTEDGFGNKLNPASLDEPIKSYDQLIEALEFFATTDHEYKTIVIDHLNTIETLVYDAILKREGGSMFEPHQETSMTKASGGYGNAYKEAYKYWTGKFWFNILKLREKGLFTVLIAHRGLTEVADPINGNYTHYAPNLRDDVVEFLRDNVNCIFYATRKNDAQGDGPNNPRIIKAHGNRHFIAKTQYGNFDECNLNFKDLAKKINYITK